MKKALISLTVAAASALALSAGAAAAQPYGYDHRPYYMDRDERAGIDQREAMLDHRIDQGIRDGSLSRREAFMLRREFNRITWLEARYRADGLNGWERADLDRRLDRLSDQVRAERHDDQYGYGYGREWRR